MDELFEYMNNQIELKYSQFKRYIYDKLPWEAQMFALIGPRGIGKTTVFLQHINDEHKNDEALYVSADHIYFANHSLLELSDKFYKFGGRYLYIDEIHNYENWARELKNIYDGYPDLHVYFTGSSALNILGAEADLSRRAPIFHMQGLSFREFLELKKNVKAKIFTLEEILAGKATIKNVKHPLPLFQEYLQKGYYPFMDDIAYEMRIEQTVNATLQYDIPQIANLSIATSRKLKRLMAAIAESVPFKPNTTKLAKKIGSSRNSIEEYLNLMERAGMIMRLRSGHALFAELGKVEKIYLDNPTLMYALSGKNTDIGTIRETFFANQMRLNHDVLASDVSDFKINDATFEIGGKSKTRSQIAGVKNAYVVKDEIENAFDNIIPLWCFGLNY